jgi:hypothetical protein
MVALDQGWRWAGRKSVALKRYCCRKAQWAQRENGLGWGAAQADIVQILNIARAVRHPLPAAELRSKMFQ